jgi:paraquat-inducible protein B
MPATPEATFHPSRWPGWIWLVPIGALLIVGWLGVRDLLQQGPEVTVRFAEMGDIKAGNTKVKYQDMEVGTVESVKLADDLRHIDVGLRLRSQMSGHLGPGTRYWIAGQNISLGDLSGIKAIISGPYIAIEPQAGDTVDKVEGLDKPPAIKEKRPGTVFTLQTGKLDNIKSGTEVFFLGLKVGKVESHAFDDQHRNFNIEIFIEAPYDKLVHEDTHFWNAGAVHLSESPSGPSVAFRSLPALVQGAVGFETPDDSGAKPADKDTVFTLFADQATARNAPSGTSVTYSVNFDDQSTGLAVGSPVKLIDTPIGSVTQSTVEYDVAKAVLRTRATLSIDPDKLHLTGTKGDPRVAIDNMMRALIGQGLRASLTKAPPVIGSPQVELQFVPGAQAASLGSGSPPEIPTESGSGSGALLAKARDILDQVQQVTQRLSALSQSPEVTQSLEDLHQTLDNVQAVTTETRKQIGPILTQVRQAATHAQEAADSARSVLGNGAGRNQVESAGLSKTLYEMTQAARALRELADYLDRHPEALISGKTNRSEQ